VDKLAAINGALCKLCDDAGCPNGVLRRGVTNNDQTRCQVIKEAVVHGQWQIGKVLRMSVC
jgi:hypothetical protein